MLVIDDAALLVEVAIKMFFTVELLAEVLTLLRIGIYAALCAASTCSKRKGLSALTKSILTILDATDLAFYITMLSEVGLAKAEKTFGAFGARRGAAVPPSRKVV